MGVGEPCVVAGVHSLGVYSGGVHSVGGRDISTEEGNASKWKFGGVLSFSSAGVMVTSPNSASTGTTNILVVF